jgi:hypothetical protein
MSDVDLEQTIEVLKNTKLAPSLCTDQRQYLIDTLKDVKLQEKYDTYRKLIRMFIV